MKLTIKRFNKWYKKWKYLVNFIGFVILLLGLYSLKLSIDSFELSKKIYTETQTPTWVANVEYQPDNLSVSSISFKSTLSEIELQKFEIVYLDLNYVFQTYENLGSSIYGINFIPDLNKIISGYLVFPEDYGFDVPLVYNINNCYPIVIIFTYALRGQVNQVTSLFKLHFSILKKDRIKIRGLEFVRNLNAVMNTDLQNFNCEECIGVGYCESDSTLRRFLSNKANYRLAYDLAYLNQITIEKTISIDDGSGTSQRVFLLPAILVDRVKRNEFNRSVLLIEKNILDFDLRTQAWIRNIKEFTEMNYLCEEIEKNCFSSSSWLNKETMEIWDSLNHNYAHHIIDLSKKD